MAAWMCGCSQGEGSRSSDGGLAGACGATQVADHRGMTVPAPAGLCSQNRRANEFCILGGEAEFEYACDGAARQAIPGEPQRRSSLISTRGKPLSTEPVSAALVNPAFSNRALVPTYAIVRSTFCPRLSTG